MSEKMIDFSRPVSAKEGKFKGFLVNDIGVFGVLENGELEDVGAETLASLSGQEHYDDTFAGRVAMVEIAVGRIAVHWSDKGETFDAETLNAATWSAPSAEMVQVMGANDAATALHSLNQPLEQYHGPMVQALRADAVVSVGALAGKLAEGIAGSIGGVIGTMIMDAIFPQKSMQSYFDELYDKICILVHKEIVGNQIQLINGKINGTIQYVRNVYQPRKDAGASKAELSNLLQPYLKDMYLDVVAPLQEQNYQEPGFSVFLLGASMQVSLLQEMALVDPGASDPRKSSYAGSVSRQSKDNLAYAKDLWEKLSSMRSDKIETKIDYIYLPTYGKPNPVFSRGRIIDNFTGKTIWETNNQVDWIFGSKKRADEYKASVKKDFSIGLAGLDGIDALFNNWNVLVGNPLPRI